MPAGTSRRQRLQVTTKSLRVETPGNMKASVGEYMAKVYRLAVGNSINVRFGRAIAGGDALRCLLVANFNNEYSFSELQR